MSFFFETVKIPFWFIVFIFASAGPLWFKWASKFHKKFIVTGILEKIFHRAKSNAEMKIDVLKKATDHWNQNSELSGFSDSEIRSPKSKVKKHVDASKKQNIRDVLKELSAAGEVGILPKSISDKTKINTLDTTSSLIYLEEKKYAEVINSTNGSKYYLTELGRRYCLNKKYISKS